MNRSASHPNYENRCSIEIQATTLDSIAMEPRALGVSSTLAPWSIAFIGHQKKKSDRGVKGDLPPWDASPSGGLWGSPSQIH